MAVKYFAKLGLNGEVLAVNGLGDNVAPTEKRGIQYLTDITGWAIWRETSESGDRKNFAGIGDKFDEDKNAFIRPKPYPSWILNEDTCLWEAPVAQTENAKDKWNEETTSWE